MTYEIKHYTGRNIRSSCVREGPGFMHFSMDSSAGIMSRDELVDILNGQEH
jgi:hypothetical protein